MHWRTSELLEQVRAIDPDVVVNDRWCGGDRTTSPTGRPPTSVRTFEYDAARRRSSTSPWELCRGIGSSFCHNRAERAEHHMSALRHRGAADRGGRQGRPPAAERRARQPTAPSPSCKRRPLLEAGWRGSAAPISCLIGGATPWDVVGRRRASGTSTSTVVLHAVDLSGPRTIQPHSTPDRDTAVESVDDSAAPRPSRSARTTTALHLGVAKLGARAPVARSAVGNADHRLPDSRASSVERPVELFAPGPRQPIELAPAASVASRTGDIVQLGDGTVYSGPSPCRLA